MRRWHVYDEKSTIIIHWYYRHHWFCFLALVELEKASGMSGAKIVTIYNWGDYIDPSLITKFEQESGYKVNYETFDSNEAMFTKIQQGGTNL